MRWGRLVTQVREAEPPSRHSQPEAGNEAYLNEIVVGWAGKPAQIVQIKGTTAYYLYITQLHGRFEQTLSVGKLFYLKGSSLSRFGISD
jgi:hypothetical protein